MNFDVEKAVIGCLMLDPDGIDKIRLTLSEEKFSDPYLGRAYREILSAHDNGLGSDLNTLMFQMGDLPQGIIVPLLTECVECVSTSIGAERYADLVAKGYKSRMLGKLLNSYDGAGDADEKIADLQKQLESLSTDRRETSMDAGQMADEYEPTRGVDTREQGVRFGIGDIDDKVGGLDGGDICVIGARPAVGKTAFAIELMLQMAKAGHRAELFSLEMSNEQIYDRLIAHESGIELMRVRRALNFNASERERFARANGTLRELKDRMVFVDDAGSVSEMYASMKRHRPDIAIVDYVQLVRPEGRYRGNRYAEVGEISHNFKAAAKKLGIPVILLCQLNRTYSEEKEPSMNELRESGDLEQDASVVMLLWNKNQEKTEKGVKVDKNRNGATGTVTLGFDGKTMRFSGTGEFYDADGDNPFD